MDDVALSRPGRNIELKARYADLPAAQRIVQTKGARLAGVVRQVDTYFHSEGCRLKLRHIDDREAELIEYRRPDSVQSRACSYTITPVAPEDAEALIRKLSAESGQRGQVRKVRGIYLWHNVRIHLDDVEQLGTFIEFEAVMGAGEDDATSYRRLAELSAALGIDPKDHVPQSYIDLVTAQSEVRERNSAEE